jgi:hypothetical protein
VKETRGTLADIRQVTLVLNRRTASDDSSPTWEVAVAAPQWEDGVVLESTLREEAGYAALKKWAERLRLDAVDRSGDEEVRTAWNQMDRAVLAAGAFSDAGVDDRVSALPRHPPPQSRILVVEGPGRSRILLPPIGWNTGATFLTLFGTLFGGIGGTATLAALNILKGIRVNGRILDGPDWGFAAFTSVFLLIGVAIVVGTIVGTRASELIEDAGDELVLGFKLGDFGWGKKRLPKRDVLDLDLSAGPMASAGNRRHTQSSPPSLPKSPRDIRIRTDKRVIRFGKDLSEEEQQWLLGRLNDIVHRAR